MEALDSAAAALSISQSRSRSHFEDLPDDILSQILALLDLPELLKLQGVSNTLKLRVKHIGLPSYLSHHPQHHVTLSGIPRNWDPIHLIRHNHYITTSLEKRRWHALQVGQSWQPAIPTINLTPDMLILGVGGKLVVHPLRESGHCRSVGRAKEYVVTKKYVGSKADIVGVHVLPDGQVAVAQYDGTLQRITIPPALDWQAGIRSTAHYPHPKNSNIQTLSGCGDALLTGAADGLVSLFNARSPWQAPATFTLRSTTRAWSTLLTSSSAILGLSDRIAIHAVTPSSLSATPLRSLHGPDLPITSSAYALRSPPSTSIHNPSTLLSAWYDSHLRLHDLRSSSPGPVQTFSDPWAWADGSAMYSAAFLAEYHIAGGGARHGTVSMFDTRYPKKGWSCFSPGGKGSPVYAMEAEGGRLWGVTDKRAFVLAFDGSGGATPDGGAGGGLVEYMARARRSTTIERPNGWKGGGGKWNWTVKHLPMNKGDYGPGEDDEGESAVGYDHNDRGGINLFDSLPVIL